MEAARPVLPSAARQGGRGRGCVLARTTITNHHRRHKGHSMKAMDATTRPMKARRVLNTTRSRTKMESGATGTHSYRKSTMYSSHPVPLAILDVFPNPVERLRSWTIAQCGEGGGTSDSDNGERARVCNPPKRKRTGRTSGVRISKAFERSHLNRCRQRCPRPPPEQVCALFLAQYRHTLLLDVLADVPRAEQVRRVGKHIFNRELHCRVGICYDHPWRVRVWEWTS